MFLVAQVASLICKKYSPGCVTTGIMTMSEYIARAWAATLVAM